MLKQENAASVMQDFKVDGIRICVYRAKSGFGLPKHSHSYSHVTLCATGKIKVTKEKGELILSPESNAINLAPVEWHEIEALEDETVFINLFSDGKY